MSDNKSGVAITQTAGRDQIGATAGVNNMVEIGDIANFRNWVEGNSGTTDSDLRSALTGAWAELEKVVTAPADRDAVLSEYKKLAAEAVKLDKNPTVLKMAWGRSRQSCRRSSRCRHS